MKSGSEKTILDWVLYYHRLGINVVQAYYKGKCPPKGGEWQKYKKQRVTEEELKQWFGDGKWRNIAAVTGPISHGLTVLDFDSPEAYRWWAERNPDLVAKLPTSKSARGFHVFFRSKLTKSDTTSYCQMHIKANGLVLLPPSMHKSGVRYEWIIPLSENEELPELNPLEWQLDKFTEDTEEPEDSEDTQDTERHRSHRGEREFLLDYLDDEIKIDVEKAIECTLPKKQGQRNDAIFPLCQWLKAIPELKDKTAKELEPIVREWHKRAYPVIGTKPFTNTWRDFVHSWKRVNWPKGEVVLRHAVKKALENVNVPPEVQEYDTPEACFLLRICYHLQQGMGDKPFFLASRTAGGILGESHRTAYKLLEMFVADGKLELVEKHTTKKAPRYRYIAN